MGDIANMHLEAIENGLDPDEMDGSDWAHFIDCETVDIADLLDELGCTARMLLSMIDDNQDKDDFSASIDARAEALLGLLPNFGDGHSRLLVRTLMKLSSEANAEADRARKAKAGQVGP